MNARKHAPFAMEFRPSAKFFTLLLFVLSILVANSSATAAGATWIGAVDGTFATGANWDPGTPGNISQTATADVAVFANNTNTSVTVDNGRTLGAINFNAGGGAFVLGGGPLFLSNITGTNAGITVDSGVTSAQTFTAAIQAGGSQMFFDNSSNTSAAALTLGDLTGSSGVNTLIQLRGGNTGLNAVSGVIADGAGRVTSLTKSGNGGVWYLTGNNTFTGSVTVQKGTLAVNSLAALGNGTGPVTLGGEGGPGAAVFSYRGNSATFTRGFEMNWTANHLIESTVSGQTLTISMGNITGDDAANSLIFGGEGTIEVASNILLRNIAKTNTGTLILSGSNTLNGATAGVFSVLGGVVVLNSDHALGASARLSLNGGGIQAGGTDRSYSNLLEIGVGNSAIFSGSHNLSFTGGMNFMVTNNAGSVTNNMINGAALTLGGTISLAAEGPGTNELRVNGSGTTIFSGNITDGLGTSNRIAIQQTARTVVFSGSNSYTGNTLIGNGGNNPTLVIANDYALAGGGHVVFNGGILQSDGADRTFSNIIDVANSANIATASFTGTQSMAFAGGLNVTNATGNLVTEIANNIAAGKTLTLGGPISASTSGNNNTLAFNGTGETRVTGNISNGGGNNTSLQLRGSGLVVLSGTNTFTGTILFANNGVRKTLRLDGTSALASGNLDFGASGNGVVELGAGNGSFTRSLGTGAGQVRWQNGNGGFGAYGADAVVNLGGAGATYTWASTANFLQTFQSLLLSSATSDHKVTWVNGIDLNAATRTIEVSNGSAAVDAEISGILSGTGSSSFQKTGAGVLELSGANTYAGVTYIEEGTLRASSVDTSGGSSNLGAVASVQLGTGTSHGGLEYVGASGTFNGSLHVNVGGGRLDTATAGQMLTVTTAGGGISGSGTLTLGGAGQTVLKSSVQTGAGGIVKTGSGTAVIAGADNNYFGATGVNVGSLLITGTVTNTGSVSVASGARLTVDGFVNTSALVTVNGELNGHGRVGIIGGSGLVGPGNSPGILTANAVTVASGLDFAFEFSSTGSPAYGNAAASVNDVLRLTGATPFTQSLDATNTISIYFNVGSLESGDVFRGGFYTDNNTAFLAEIANAQFVYYLFNGEDYDLYTGPLTFNVSTVSETATFSDGIVSGYVTEFAAVPEPGTSLLTMLGLTGLLHLGRRHRNAA